MEIVMEILLELYCELMLMAIPTKGKSKGMLVFAGILSGVMLCGCMVLFLAGTELAATGSIGWGVLCILASVAISLAHMIAGILLQKKKN